MAGFGPRKITRMGSISDFFTGSVRFLRADHTSETSDENEPEPPPQIIFPPGYSVERILRFLLPKKDFEDIFDPALTDMRIAYFDAVSDGEDAKAKWIKWREHIRIVWVFAIYLGFATWTRQIRKLLRSINAREGDDRNEEE